MAETTIHFRDIHSASCTDDGKNVVISVSAPSGIRSILLPARAVHDACSTLLEACANAKRISGDDEIKPPKITKIGFSVDPDNPTEAFLSINIRPDSASLNFHMPRQELVGFARDILEAEGLLKTAKSSRSQ